MICRSSALSTAGILALMSVLSNTAFAQDMEEFKSKMADAAAMVQVDMNEALQLYLELRTQYSGAMIDFSIGRTYQRMFQCEEAKRYYTQVMTVYDLPDTDQIYNRAVSAFDEIASCDTWQKVTIQCEIPAGGYVMIDDERMSSCWNRAYMFPDGEHRVKIVAPDGRETEQKFTAKSGNAPQTVKAAFEVKPVEIEKRVEIEKAYILKDRFSPHLYWGLIAGGAVAAGVGGVFGMLAHENRTEEQKWVSYMGLYYNDAERYAEYESKRNDAQDKVKVYNAVMYGFVGVGGALAVTGAILAIVNAVSEKTREEVSSDSSAVNAYFSPSLDGVSMGIGLRF